MTEPHDGDFPDGLSAAELGMWQAFRNGSTYDLRARDPAQDDPFAPRVWGPERSVDGRVVARLLLSGPPPRPGRVAALKLRGVRITGVLDLAGGRVAPYVEMTGCRFESEVVLPECHFTTLRIVGCAMPRLEAARLRTEGDLHLPRCRIPRGIRLTDAQIGTDLLINQIEIGPDRGGRALAGDGLAVAQDLQAELIEARGELSLRGAKVGGSLSLRGSRLRGREGRRALNAPQLTVERTLYMSEAWVSVDTGIQGTTPRSASSWRRPRRTAPVRRGSSAGAGCAWTTAGSATRSICTRRGSCWAGTRNCRCAGSSPRSCGSTWNGRRRAGSC